MPAFICHNIRNLSIFVERKRLNPNLGNERTGAIVFGTAIAKLLVDLEGVGQVGIGCERLSLKFLAPVRQAVTEQHQPAIQTDKKAPRDGLGLFFDFISLFGLCSSI